MVFVTTSPSVHVARIEALDLEPPILAAIESNRELAGLVHIVEPWDLERAASLPGSKVPARGIASGMASFAMICGDVFGATTDAPSAR